MFSLIALTLVDIRSVIKKTIFLTGHIEDGGKFTGCFFLLHDKDERPFIVLRFSKNIFFMNLILYFCIYVDVFHQ